MVRIVIVEAAEHHFATVVFVVAIGVAQMNERVTLGDIDALRAKLKRAGDALEDIDGTNAVGEFSVAMQNIARRALAGIGGDDA